MKRYDGELGRFIFRYVVNGRVRGEMIGGWSNEDSLVIISH